LFPIVDYGVSETTFRVNVVQLHIPALETREKDEPWIALECLKRQYSHPLSINSLMNRRIN